MPEVPRVPEFRLTRRYERTSDPDLITACLKGDAVAWDTLIHRYEAFVFSILLRMGLPQADAEDIFQEVCLLLFHHLGDLRDTSRLSSWLGATTKREAWRLHRRRSANPTSSLTEQEWALVDTRDAQAEGQSPLEAAILALEDQHLVRRGVELLAERCRNLLTLLYCEDPPSSYAETSQRLSIPLGSIGPARARCLQSLQKILLELGF